MIKAIRFIFPEFQIIHMMLRSLLLRLDKKPRINANEINNTSPPHKRKKDNQKGRVLDA